MLLASLSILRVFSVRSESARWRIEISRSFLFQKLRPRCLPVSASSEIIWSRNLLCRCILIRKTVYFDRGIDQWIIVLHLERLFVYFDIDRFSVH